MQKKHFIIPIFIPQLACPFQCIYCNQHNISGILKEPTEQEIIKIIEQHLSTIPSDNNFIEVGIFGGSFTCLPENEQEKYLKIIQPFFESGAINGIRLSTRPDFINEDILKVLKRYNVATIELGAQSLDDEVLKLSGRGHKAKDIINASKLIKQNGFSLGLQMMLGLPGDTLERSLKTAKAIVTLNADNTRIYPTLVIKDTTLEKLYRENNYMPLPLEDAVEWAKECYKIFEEADVKVLRMGLHPSEGLLSGESLVAGPFHVSFGELVMTALWKEIYTKEKVFQKRKLNNSIIIAVPKGQLNAATGYNASNKKILLQSFNKVKIIEDPLLTGRNYHADYC